MNIFVNSILSLSLNLPIFFKIIDLSIVMNFIRIMEGFGKLDFSYSCIL